MDQESVLLKRTMASMIIFTNSKVTSNHTTRENILGTKTNLTNHMGKTGIPKPKHLPLTPTTNQVSVHLVLRLVLLALVAILLSKNKSMIIYMSNNPILSHTIREITHGTKMNMTTLMVKTGTRKPKLHPLILITNQE
jgi:hypothetical protein